MPRTGQTLPKRRTSPVEFARDIPEFSPTVSSRRPVTGPLPAGRRVPGRPEPDRCTPGGRDRSGRAAAAPAGPQRRLGRDAAAAADAQPQAVGRRRHCADGLNLTEARVLATVAVGGDSRALQGNANQVALAALRNAGYVTDDHQPTLTDDAAFSLLLGCDGASAIAGGLRAPRAWQRAGGRRIRRPGR